MKPLQLDKASKPFGFCNIMLHKKLSPYLGLSISIVLCTVLMLSCKTDQKSIAHLQYMNEADSAMVMTDKDSHILYTEMGRRKMSLKAGRLTLYKKTDQHEEYKEATEGFLAVFFLENGVDTSSFISGEIAKTFDNENKLEIIHDVVVYNKKNNETLYTEKLFWDRQTELIWSDEKVKIVTPDGILFGEGVEANQNFDEGYTIKRPTGNFEFDEKSLDSEASDTQSETAQ